MWRGTHVEFMEYYSCYTNNVDGTTPLKDV